MTSYIAQGPRGGLAGVRDDYRKQGYSRRKADRKLRSLVALAGSDGMSALQRKRAGLAYGTGWKADRANRLLEREGLILQLEEQGLSKTHIMAVCSSRRVIRNVLNTLQAIRDAQ